MPTAEVCCRHGLSPASFYKFRSKYGGMNVYLHELQDGFQAKRIIDSWIGFYNAERPHTALEKRTPDDPYFDAIQMNRAA